MEHAGGQVVRSDWEAFVDLKIFCNVFCNAQAEFKKLLNAAEFAHTRNPKLADIKVMLIVYHVMSRVGVYDHFLTGRIMDILYEVDGHFIRLFLGILFRDEGISETEARTVEYFLTIGSKKRYRLRNGKEVRFVDVPFKDFTLAGMALRSGRPFALKMFLKFGADPLAALEILAITGATTNPRRMPRKRKRALKLLISAAPQLPPLLSSLLNTPLGPLPLKHSCKVVVRRCLAEAGHLPFGIPVLRIPSELHRYLDLEAP